jgi:hypothetical protein
MILSQKSCTPAELKTATLSDNGLAYVGNKILIPCSDMDMISRICIVAHAGSAGHRGIAYKAGNPTSFLFQQHGYSH